MAKVISLTTHPAYKPDATEEKKGGGRKPKGMRKDGRVKRTFTHGKRPDGKPNEIPFYGKTVAEAEAKRDAYKAMVKAGIDMSRKNITVSEWLDEWKKAYKGGLEEGSEQSLQSHMKRITDRIGEMKVVDVRNIHLSSILNEMEGYSTSAVRSVRQVMTGAFSMAVENRIIQFNPAGKLKMPDTEDGSHRALEGWESDLILKQWRLHRFGPIIKAMLLTGMRPGEAVALTWKKIDMKKRTVTVDDAAKMPVNKPKNRGKTKTEAGERVIPICDELYAMLEETPVDARKGYVFLSAHSKQLSASALERGLDGYLYTMSRFLNGDDLTKQQTGRPHRKDLSKAKDEAQRQKWQKKNEAVDAWEAARKKIEFRFYDLRHTFCTAMYDADVDVKTAAYFMGHKDVETTLRIYAHLTDERKKAGAAKMTNFLDGWKSLNTSEGTEDEGVKNGSN